MGAIYQQRIRSGAIDGSGNATALSKGITGKILAVNVNYNGDADMTLSLYEMNPEDSTDFTKTRQTILNGIASLGAAPLDDNDTYYPRTSAQDNDGSTAKTYDGTYEVPTEFIVNGLLGLKVSSGTENDSVEVIVIYEF